MPKTSTIVRQERTKGILLSSGAMAVSWPLEFRTWRRRSFLLHTSANIAGKYSTIHRSSMVSRNSLRRGITSSWYPTPAAQRIAFRQTAKRRFLRPAFMLGVKVRAAYSKSGWITDNYKKMFSWHWGSADETTVYALQSFCQLCSKQSRCDKTRIVSHR